MKVTIKNNREYNLTYRDLSLERWYECEKGSLYLITRVEPLSVMALVLRNDRAELYFLSDGSSRYREVEVESLEISVR